VIVATRYRRGVAETVGRLRVRSMSIAGWAAFLRDVDLDCASGWRSAKCVR